jgi:DNA-binding NtrC family response regulator
MIALEDIAGILIANGMLVTSSIKTLQEIRKEHICKVLEKTHWNLKEASVILEISEDVLVKEINSAGITRTKIPHQK